MKLFLLSLIFFFTFSNSVIADTTSDNLVDVSSITVVYAHQWRPYSYGNGSEVEGILVDIVEEILHKQLKFDVKHMGQPWKRAQKSVRSGLFDAMITAVTPERLTYTKSTSENLYILEWKVFVSNKSSQYRQIMESKEPLEESNLNFIALLGDGTSERFYKEKDVKFKLVKNISNAIKMLQKGRADVFMNSKIMTLDYINKQASSSTVSMHSKKYKSIGFTFLLSKKSNVSHKVIEKIDEVILEMKSKNTFQSTLKKIENNNIGTTLLSQ